MTSSFLSGSPLFLIIQSPSYSFNWSNLFDLDVGSATAWFSQNTTTNQALNNSCWLRENHLLILAFFAFDFDEFARHT
jgi:hypothetical protein